MALEKTFRELCGLIRKLQDHVLLLQLNIREDVPAQGGVVLIDKLGDGVDDLLGSLQEASAAAAEALDALQPILRLDSAARALARCQEQFHSVELHFQSELVSYERIADLTCFALSRGGEWLSWVKSVRQGLDQCKQPSDDISRALLACWQEIAERMAAGAGSGTAKHLQRPHRSKAATTGVA